MRLARVIALAVALAPVGCVFFVSTPEPGPHCAFQGEKTECGTCLATECRAAIDAACGNEKLLSLMEQCATAGDKSCGQLPASDVATCMHEKCDAVCYTKVGKSVTHCSDSFLAPGLACSCDTDGAPNDFACSSTTFPRTRCCAPTGWPGPALECTCNAFACFPTSDGCNCVLSDNLDASTAQECHGTHCCAVGDHCQCGQRACTGSEREVPACVQSEVVCPPGTTEVKSCAIRQ